MIQAREREAKTTWVCESASHSVPKCQVIIVLLDKTEPVKIAS